MTKLWCGMLVGYAAVAFVATAAIAPDPLERELEDRTFWGRAAVYMGTPTEMGDWNGTWFYQNRDFRMALWLRTDGSGKPELRFQYQSIASPEAFETDWTGSSRYFLAGQPVTFAIKITDGDADAFKGSWTWDVEFEDSSRTEAGHFIVRRVSTGRSLVVFFEDFERTLRRRDSVTKTTTPPAWAFAKASKRLILWDEIPW